MRIIDANEDFYDFCQYTYPDKTLVFDRRDSYVLTRKEFADNFYSNKFGYLDECLKERHERHFVLLQICHSFWLFELKITKEDNLKKCIDYDLILLANWKNYDIERELIKLSNIKFRWFIQKSNEISNIVNAINTNDFETKKAFNEFYVYKGTFDKCETKHIPILKNIGIASLVNPYDIYYSLEEYFGEEKSMKEKTEAIGTTDSDKAYSHGFDPKKSFRKSKNRC